MILRFIRKHPIVIGILFICLCVFLLSGCFLKAVKPVCETEQPSVLCEATAKLSDQIGHEITLDDISLSLKIGNTAALEKQKYTAQEAVDFIDDCDTYLDTHQGMTYGDFVAELTARYLKLPTAVQVAFIIMSDEYEIDVAEFKEEPLTEYDYYLLRRHLEKQRVLAVPYLQLE